MAEPQFNILPLKKNQFGISQGYFQYLYINLVHRLHIFVKLEKQLGPVRNEKLFLSRYFVIQRMQLVNLWRNGSLVLFQTLGDDAMK